MTLLPACRLARFWLRWQVRVPLHLAFVAWRAVARWQRREEQQAALAQALRRLLLLRRGQRSACCAGLPAAPVPALLGLLSLAPQLSMLAW